MINLNNISTEQKIAIVGTGIAGVIASLFLSQSSSSIKELNTRMVIGGMIGLSIGYFGVKQVQSDKKK